HRHDDPSSRAQLVLERSAVGAQGMCEFDDDLARGGRRPELDQIDAVDPPGANPTEPRREAIDLAAHAEPGRSREQGERRDEHPQDRPPPREDREERERPNDRLICPWRAGVDHVGVAVGVGLANHRRTSSKARSEECVARSTSHRANRACGSKPTSDGASVTKLESALMSYTYGRPSRAATRYSTPPTSSLPARAMR